MKRIVWLSAIIILTFSNILRSEGDEKNKNFQKSASYTSHTRFNINNISTWIYNDGTADININGNSGFEFPKGSRKTAIFQSGFLWGGKVNGQIRVGGSAYRSGLMPGRILNNGVPWDQLQAENPNDPHVRIYRVRSNYKRADLSDEVNDGEGTSIEIRDQYEKDWNEWPAQFGAPYLDLDGNGVYNPSIDVPGVPGADQTIWYVANDLDSNQTKFLYGSLPLGTEIQVTIWGYKSVPPLSNLIFKKYKFINKSDTEITDTYLSYWNDPDLGDASDDYVGCDTLLNLGFVYNAHSPDQIYGTSLASAGCRLLQGPIVDGLPTDSAFFNGEVIYGKKNLPMTAHYFIISPDAIYRDPTQGQYIGSLEFYNLFQGRSAATGELFPIPPQLGGGSTMYPLSGDPVTGEGFIDGIIHPPGDRRNGISSGPFNLAPGDTQEVVLVQIAAGGVGTVTNLMAVGLLKQYTVFADMFYNLFLNNSVLPHKPVVNVTELDRQIVLNWGSDINSVRKIENYDVGGYKFQGYNIYQLPSKDAPIEDGVRLATFDIVDDVTAIIDYEIDPITGWLVTAVKQFGNNSGIERYINITKDSIGNKPLNNGSVYYFGVTAYTYNSSGISPNNFESELQVIRAVPQSEPPGVRYEGKFGEKLEIIHEQGLSNGLIEVQIIDPTHLTGNSYKINFEIVEGKIFWKLQDYTLGIELLSAEVKQLEDSDYFIVDGLRVLVADKPIGLKRYGAITHPNDPDLWGWEVISGNDCITWSNASLLNFEAYNGAIGYANPYSFFNNNPNPVTPDKLKNVLIKFGRVPDGSIAFENPGINPNIPSSDQNFSYAYRYGRGLTLPPAKTEFAPYILNTGSGYSYQDFNKSVPLSAWNIDDPNNPHRLAVGFLENNAINALLDGRYWPGNNNSYNNIYADGPREWLFIFDADYSEIPNPDYQIDILNNPVPILYWFTVNRRGEGPFSPGATGEDQFAIYPNKVFTEEDVYSFTAPGITLSDQLAKEDVKKINVFPNPYYGSNPQEASSNETFVTFNHLPQRAIIRVFNLAGQLVRKIEKDSPAQFEIWELQNDHGIPVASGIFIVYIEMPDLNETKILKLAIIQRQIIPKFH